MAPTAGRSVLLTAIYALNVADQYVVPTVFPLLKQEFGLSDSALGMLSGSYVIVVMVFSIPFGYIADRLQPHAHHLVGHGGVGRDDDLHRARRGTTPACSSARMTLGAWDPCDNPTSQSLLADYYPTVQRSKVMSVYQVGQLLGVFLIPIAAAMATNWGWRSAFYFLAIPAFIVAILARRLPEPVRGQQDRIQLGLDADAVAESQHDTMSCQGGVPRDPPLPHVRADGGLVDDRLAVLRQPRHVVADLLRALPRHDPVRGRRRR